MAEKSGFFDALLANGQYDRVYSANDYCNALRMIANTGVCYSPDDELHVTVSGMAVSVTAGRALIDGHYYINDSTHTAFTVPTAPTGDSKRIDRVVLRLDTTVATRSIRLVYKTGTASATPTAPALTRSGNVYEIALADIYVNSTVTSITSDNVTDQRENSDVCGWLTVPVPAVPTLVKQYVYRTTLETATKTVTFEITQYDPTGTDIVNVYVNGLLELENVDYTLSGRVITFTANKTAGTEITVIVLKSIDGTGLGSVSDEITALQNAVSGFTAANQYNYICNGVDDNVKLSELAAELLQTRGTNYDTITVNVIGTIGVKAAYSGAGTTASPYRWFVLNNDNANNKRLRFDFGNCTSINIPMADGTYNVVFYGDDLHISGANVICSNIAENSIVKIFNTSGVVFCENSRFWITAYKDSVIAHSGTFKNCRGSVTNVINNSYCFLTTSAGLVRVEGGEYYAYTGASGSKSAVVGQSGADAVSILYGVNAPTTNRGGYYQTNAVLQFEGGGVVCCTDMITTLPLSVIDGISNIRGTISKNKPGLM